MLNPAQNKPMTRQQLAEHLGISTKTLSRFLQKEEINIHARVLLKPKFVDIIIQKYFGD